MTITAVLLASKSDGPRRLAKLNALAEKSKLVSFKLVDSTAEQNEIVKACTGAKVLVAPDRISTVEIAKQVKGLELVQTFSAGTERLDKALLLNHGIKVANNGGANAVCVAELTVALIVTILHKLDMQIESVRAGRWAQGVTGKREDFQTLVDKRIGIVGLGRIGSRVAKRLVGWECDIVYHDVAEVDADYEAKAGAHRVPFEELLATSDIITLHVPLDRLTRGLFSDAQFKAMKKTAVLINTCRGPVVDEAALIRALKAGEIHGAGMDVTEKEPIDPKNPLIKLPNVVITPHQGARAVQSEQNATKNAVANAERIARGREPLWIVDPV